MAKTSIQKLRVKKEVISFIEVIFDVLDQREDNVRKDYLPVRDSDEQDTHWKTGELLWEDEEKTIPKMKKVYDYVEKPELTDEDKAKLEAIEVIRTALEKLV